MRLGALVLAATLAIGCGSGSSVSRPDAAATGGAAAGAGATAGAEGGSPGTGGTGGSGGVACDTAFAAHNIKIWKQFQRTSLSDISDAPNGITAGPDGNIWFTLSHAGDTAGDSFGRLATDGTVTLFPVLTPPGQYAVSGVNYITSGLDGNLWITEETAIAKATPSGSVMEFPVGTTDTPSRIIYASSGLIWFVSDGLDGIITHVDMTGGNPSMITLPKTCDTCLEPEVLSIAEGLDSDVWVLAAVGNGGTSGVARIKSDGSLVWIGLPGIALEDNASQIVLGSDKNMWVTGPAQISRFAPSDIAADTYMSFKIPSGALARGIASGADGNMWFSEYNKAALGSVPSTGEVNEITWSSECGVAGGDLATGPDGNIWFVMPASGNQYGSIAQITVH
jgi:virginiamycin B lyase